MLISLAIFGLLIFICYLVEVHMPSPERPIKSEIDIHDDRDPMGKFQIRKIGDHRQERISERRKTIYKRD